ncbi:MAG: chitobiase/beta-hexosaminidase C-terminal domain-containing protein, partial [Cohnella sp.]|nr:chitobiase/beta-hexosaminidase C-terminal domain-containing protein [Cohnella sp.]
EAKVQYVSIVEQKKKEEEEKKKEEEKKNIPITYPIFTPSDTPLSIAEAKQVGAKTFRLKFNKNADPATIRLSVSRDGSPIDVQAVPDANGYNLTFAEKVSEGRYIVTASYADSSSVIGSASVDAYNESVAKIEFVNSSDTVAKGARIGILVKATNQFGESMPNLSGFEVISSVPATIESDRTIIVANTSSESLQSVISITVANTVNHVSVTKNFRVGTEPIAATTTFIGSLRGIDGQEVSQADWTHTYHMNFDAYDQYGHLLLYPLPSTAGTVLTSLTPHTASISAGSLIQAPAGEPGTFSLPITLNPSGPEAAKEYTLTLSVGGASVSQSFHVVDSPVQILATPTADPASGVVASGTQVSLSATGGATIHFTTDLSEPTPSSTPYTGPIVITGSTTIKAIAVKLGSTNSSVARFDYTVAMPILLPDTISPMTVGQPYAGSVAKLSGGTGAVTYAVTNGALPAGLNLNPGTGEISGTPSASGAYDFTIGATDSATPPATATKPYTGNITPAVSGTPLDLINEAAASGDWTGISETTFAEAGITGVTSEYLYGIQGILQDYDYPSAALPKTAATIQSIVTGTINLTLINNYFAYGYGTEPDRETFERADLDGVTDLNIADIVAYLQSQYGGGPGGGGPGGGSGGLYSGSSKQDIQNAINDYLDSL